jgi:hypothetical protein
MNLFMVCRKISEIGPKLDNILYRVSFQGLQQQMLGGSGLGGQRLTRTSDKSMKYAETELKPPCLILFVERTR